MCSTFALCVCNIIYIYIYAMTQCIYVRYITSHEGRVRRNNNGFNRYLEVPHINTANIINGWQWYTYIRYALYCIVYSLYELYKYNVIRAYVRAPILIVVIYNAPRIIHHYFSNITHARTHMYLCK